MSESDAGQTPHRGNGKTHGLRTWADGGSTWSLLRDNNGGTYIVSPLSFGAETMNLYKYSTVL